MRRAEQHRHAASQVAACPPCIVCFAVVSFAVVSRCWDTRHTRCWDTLRATNEHRIPQHVVDELDALNSRARFVARCAVHSHELAVGAALRSDGRVINEGVGRLAPIARVDSSLQHRN